MSGNPFSIGRDCTVILIWNGSTIQLDDVTGFSAQQEVKQQRSDPLNGVPIEFNTPSGWRGQFSVDRGNSVLDDLISNSESTFWNSGLIGSGVIYQYVEAPDRSTQNCYEFTGVSITLSNAGAWAAENIVRQTLGFFASQRQKIA